MNRFLTNYRHAISRQKWPSIHLKDHGHVDEVVLRRRFNFVLILIRNHCFSSCGIKLAELAGRRTLHFTCYRIGAGDCTPMTKSTLEWTCAPGSWYISLRPLLRSCLLLKNRCVNSNRLDTSSLRLQSGDSGIRKETVRFPYQVDC